ncbi:16S rRNA (adenine(1518)-N(6)/adenine(1519)-N(6))-dimethyltransferase RsmA [Candidatus Riesia pediculicola]|uniref:16S rRNA (adenine(1518)-N(6)/adenine(1519)-N(6))- dimethyltransferase RsmA n=1 Tax=Candidatus Riesia pediculicola TaxID=401619 RepID=UPI0009C1F635|nr:16S rRNA (adenine(1518)-N(6)/adenine(1519)-N(6))-dimethyltransferase RsmA [Candidatus Riesia pediculicola]ARC54293.1 hypothetical protein AOE57_01660 [Candidatus Riesia pediculicola]
MKSKKRFGQNFLNDSIVQDRIVTYFDPKSDQSIIEIGTGLGNLTIPIYHIIKKSFITIEIDADLIKYLLSFYPDIFQVVKILNSDIMKLDFDLIMKKSLKYRIIGSLPYNIAIPIMVRFFSHHKKLIDMHFVLQKEIVDRLIASPNIKLYGRTSVLFQYHFSINPIFHISPYSFRPIPKVNSTFVRFKPYKNRIYPICEVNLLKLITRVAFHQRRKKILNSLKEFFNIEDYSQLCIDYNMRAENLTILEYCKLTNWLSKKERN